MYNYLLHIYTQDDDAVFAYHHCSESDAVRKADGMWDACKNDKRVEGAYLEKVTDEYFRVLSETGWTDPREVLGTVKFYK